MRTDIDIRSILDHRRISPMFAEPRDVPARKADARLVAGIVRETGPSGEEDFEDARYWVAIGMCDNRSSSPDDRIVIRELTDERRNVVAATNLAEVIDQTHLVEHGSIVLLHNDANRWVFHRPVVAIMLVVHLRYDGASFGYRGFRWMDSGDPLRENRHYFLAYNRRFILMRSDYLDIFDEDTGFLRFDKQFPNTKITGGRGGFALLGESDFRDGNLGERHPAVIRIDGAGKMRIVHGLDHPTRWPLRYATASGSDGLMAARRRISQYEWEYYWGRTISGYEYAGDQFRIVGDSSYPDLPYDLGERADPDEYVAAFAINPKIRELFDERTDIVVRNPAYFLGEYVVGVRWNPPHHPEYTTGYVPLELPEYGEVQFSSRAIEKLEPYRESDDMSDMIFSLFDRFYDEAGSPYTRYVVRDLTLREPGGGPQRQHVVFQLAVPYFDDRGNPADYWYCDDVIALPWGTSERAMGRPDLAGK